MSLWSDNTLSCRGWRPYFVCYRFYDRQAKWRLWLCDCRQIEDFNCVICRSADDYKWCDLQAHRRPWLCDLQEQGALNNVIKCCGSRQKPSIKCCGSRQKPSIKCCGSRQKPSLEMLWVDTETLSIDCRRVVGDLENPRVCVLWQLQAKEGWFRFEIVTERQSMWKRLETLK
jgi:hypothetical protein